MGENQTGQLWFYKMQNSLRMKSTLKWNGELLGVVHIEKHLFSDYYPLGPTHSHIIPLDLVQRFSSGFYVWFLSFHAVSSCSPWRGEKGFDSY